jgi:peroxiredoxin
MSSSGSSSDKPSGPAPLLAILAACAVLGQCAGCHSSQAGDLAADFTLPVVRGNVFRLRSPAPQPVLLAFLQTVPDTAPTPSRSEVALLESMDRQYRTRGLRVAIVDATAIAAGRAPGHDALINVTYDWQLQFPLLEDAGSRIARSLDVTEAPATFLIRADGRIAQRWDRPPTPGGLALAIQQLLRSSALLPGSIAPPPSTRPSS